MNYSYSNNEPDEEKKPGVQVAREGGRAVAEGSVVMNLAAFQAFFTGSAASSSEAWTQARLAGILAAKQADEMVLVSHSVNISGIEMEYTVKEEERRVTVRCDVRTVERVGAETSALVGCGMTLMVLVNSLRAMDRGMSIESLRILRE
jgi:cyclic pyranopterin phosphate synthase